MSPGEDSHTTGLVNRDPLIGAVGRFHRPKITMTGPERLGRVVMGLVTLVPGIVILFSAATGVAVLVAVILVVIGPALVIAGIIGHYPLSQGRHPLTDSVGGKS